MQRIDLWKLECLFEEFKDHPVLIDVVGTIKIPFSLNCFDWDQTNDEICFGDFEESDDWFWIDKGDIVGMYNEYDMFTHEDVVKIEMHFDIFTTHVYLKHDCTSRQYIN